MVDLPQFPWNDMIDMTCGGDSGRVIGICLAAVHEAINANTQALRDLLEAQRRTAA